LSPGSLPSRKVRTTILKQEKQKIDNSELNLNLTSKEQIYNNNVIKAYALL
jgi:hypothetical protein